MKRVFKVLLVLLVALMPFVAVSAKSTKTTTTTAAKLEGKKVNFYVFHGNGCSHCADLLTYLSELDKDPEYNYMYDLVKYEVWYNAENKALMTNVFKYFGVTDENKIGVPLYVIGEEHSNGFPNPESSPESYATAIQEIKDALKKAYTNPDYKDIVAGIGSGSIDPDDSKANEAKTTNNIIGYVIIGLVVIIVIAIIFGRHNSDVYYPTEDEEDDEEVTVEEPKKEEVVKVTAKKVPVKKTATKKASTKTATKKKTTKTTSTKKTTKTNTKKK